jgi:hypothetical protein
MAILPRGDGAMIDLYDRLLVGFIRVILWTRGWRVEVVNEGETETMVISPRRHHDHREEKT